LLRFANPLFTVSQSEKTLIESLPGAATERIVVTQNGGWSNSELAVPHRSHAPDRGYALYVGSLSERKNIRGVEATAIRLAREFGLRTKLVGSSGSIFQYEEPALPNDVRHLIEYCGHVEDKDLLAELYVGARLLLFPSFYEASPLPPIEAMHFGCPVVASDIPSIRERCGDAVEYCAPGSPDSIFAAAKAILTDKTLADRLVKEGYNVEQKYSWMNQAKVIAQKLVRMHEGDLAN
jgi:glycosyltransferase involved in cell wall biosynthesis